MKLILISFFYYFILYFNYYDSKPFVLLDTTGSTYITTGDISYLNKGGDSIIAVPITTQIKIIYNHLNGYTDELYTWTGLKIADPTPPPSSSFPKAVALAPAPRSLNYLFGSTYTSNNYGKVTVWTGEYTLWSAQQVLRAPSYVDYVNSFYGSSIAFDRDDYKTLYVGCGNCSSLKGKRHGVIYTYEQGPDEPKIRPDNFYVYDQKQTTGLNLWSQRQEIYFTSLYNLGMEKIVVNKDLILADVYRAQYDTAVPANNIQKTLLMRRGPDKNVLPEQILGVDSITLSDFDLYDNTIVLAVKSQTVTALTNAGAVYILGPTILPPPAPGKPSPIQWSLQQILYAVTPAANNYFGTAVSIDGNRLSVLDTSTSSNFIFQKGGPRGKWSLQQKLTLSGTAGKQVVLRDETVVVAAADNLISMYDTFSTVDCLILSIEDHFGDGWDLARLVITLPDGTQDFLHSRCHISNPNRIRFCPRNLNDGGLYKFRVIDAKKSKNYWEILWRVFDEYSATWTVANWDTSIDYVWDTTFYRFTQIKIDKALPNNRSCEPCPIKPTDKPTPALRTRHLKDNDNNGGTAHPTHTPAPTLATTAGVNWRIMQLIGKTWYESDHQGTSYYVSDAKSHRLIAVGTLCYWETSGKQCWLDLPDGEYNIRVGGALTTTGTLQWNFCSNKNPFSAKSQLSVRIFDRECTILSYHSLTAFCGLTDPGLVAAVEFVILGATSSNELSEYDQTSLIEAIAFGFSGITTNDVKIESATQGAGIGLYVRAIITFRQSSTGYDLTNVDGIEDFVYSIETYLTNDGTRAIWSGLQSAEFKNIFHTSTGVQFVSIQIIGSDDLPLITTEVDEVVNYNQLESIVYNENTDITPTDIINLVSLSGYVITIFGILGFMISFVVYLRHKTNNAIRRDKSIKTLPILELNDTNTLSTTLSKYEEIDTSEHLIDISNNNNNNFDCDDSINSMTSEDEYSEKSDCENPSEKVSSKSKSKSSKSSKTKSSKSSKSKKSKSKKSRNEDVNEN